MCGICGCSVTSSEHVHPLEHGGHHHDHAAGHKTHHPPHQHGAHDPLHSHGDAHGAHTHDDVHHTDHGRQRDGRDVRVIRLEEQVLQKNDLLAERVRGWLLGRGAVAINFVSSPGSGKTTLLEKTIRDGGAPGELVVIQGDQATDRDAERVRQAGARALQINTGTGCHLDASMVARALAELSPGAGTMVAIENVGNLVCPALFDLGEQARVAILSVTEGADKPLKYPYMFRDASLVLLNKIDLLPYVDFDLELFENSLQKVNARCALLRVSATTGEGMTAFYEWLLALARAQADGSNESVLGLAPST